MVERNNGERGTLERKTERETDFIILVNER